MLTNAPVVNNFKKRKYERKVQRVGKVYYFTRDPVGRFIKTLIGIAGDAKVGRDIVLRRNFTEQGAGKEALYNQVVLFAPWFPAYYRACRGVDLTPEIVYDRYNKMYYKDGQAGISDEHYLQDKKLQPIVPEVDRVFNIGKPVTEDEARKIGNTSKNLILI